MTVVLCGLAAACSSKDSSSPPGPVAWGEQRGQGAANDQTNLPVEYDGVDVDDTWQAPSDSDTAGDWVVDSLDVAADPSQPTAAVRVGAAPPAPPPACKSTDGVWCDLVFNATLTQSQTETVTSQYAKTEIIGQIGIGVVTFGAGQSTIVEGSHDKVLSATFTLTYQVPAANPAENPFPTVGGVTIFSQKIKWLTAVSTTAVGTINFKKVQFNGISQLNLQFKDPVIGFKTAGVANKLEFFVSGSKSTYVSTVAGGVTAQNDNWGGQSVTAIKASLAPFVVQAYKNAAKLADSKDIFLQDSLVMDTVYTGVCKYTLVGHGYHLPAGAPMNQDSRMQWTREVSLPAPQPCPDPSKATYASLPLVQLMFSLEMKERWDANMTAVKNKTQDTTCRMLLSSTVGKPKSAVDDKTTVLAAYQNLYNLLYWDLYVFPPINGYPSWVFQVDGQGGDCTDKSTVFQYSKLI